MGHIAHLSTNSYNRVIYILNSGQCVEIYACIKGVFEFPSRYSYGKHTKNYTDSHYFINFVSTCQSRHITTSLARLRSDRKHPLFASQISLPSCWARNCTLDVFPVPVSPTNRTGSFSFTAIATRSSRAEACLVKENVLLDLK